ncbi:MAG: outer membrane beta-barrel domain-containing protein [Deltaproteobacteria bacterium]|nr:outer membrane beta-barrel domain-containing protein [Deltaproteobacteria bacterium]
MKRVVGVLALVGLGLVLPKAAGAQEEDERAETRVVQARKYVLGHEFFVAGGWLPLDAFEKAVTASGGYALHLTQELAVEVAATKSFVYDTALRDQLLSLGKTPLESSEPVSQMIAGAVSWSPFYGKLAVSSGGLLHLDFTLTAGGGYGWFSSTARPVALWGLGMRTYLSSTWSVRLDLRSLHFIETDGWDLHNEVSISLGLAASIGGAS